MKTKITKLLPPPFKTVLKKRFDLLVRYIKEPRMIYGYVDATGAYRPRTRISDTAFIYHPERVYIEDNVFVWHYTILDGTGGLRIGEGSQIGAWVGVFTHSSHIAIRIYGNHYQEVQESKKEGYPVASVTIGKYVFIGAGSKILPGVEIGDGALISADSVVKDDVEPFTIVAGDPARIIGDTRELDKKYLEDTQIREWYYEWQNETDDAG